MENKNLNKICLSQVVLIFGASYNLSLTFVRKIIYNKRELLLYDAEFQGC